MNESAEADDSSEYWVLEVQSPRIGYNAGLEYRRDDPYRSWMTGSRFETSPPEPIILQLMDTDQPNWVLPDLFLSPIAVMSRRLYDAVRGAGVDNLDTYRVELHDPVAKKVYADFVAFNLVGKIPAADRSKTRFSPDVKERMIAADIEKLVLDPSKTHGVLMFRLAESVNVILIHDDVCEAILDAGIDTLTFFHPGEVIT